MALASVVCASGVLQGRALSSMLQLTLNRQVPVRKVQKVISAAVRRVKCTSLVEDNLNYLLTSWLDAKYPLQKFPWTLAGNERWVNLPIGQKPCKRALYRKRNNDVFYRQGARLRASSSTSTSAI